MNLAELDSNSHLLNKRNLKIVSTCFAVNHSDTLEHLITS
ncbi:hypothetical protein SAMN05444271_12244 [Halohasta litchfieldiae]|uniref:Uncharacterized protein n=1 Tax=Halohasta litchfieldiae TaxID=1073996 RepID=A0A1H6W4C8_9EURY|nr:hypothetical protein SAMN05444271_12244 [Halohasta litchfieldiae]